MSSRSDIEILGTHPWPAPSTEQGSGVMNGQLSSTASLDPSAADGQENGWADMAAFRGHQRQTLAIGSDVGDDDASLLPKAQQDPLFVQEAMQFGDFRLNDNLSDGEPYISPSYSPYISPRLLPRQASQETLLQFHPGSFGLDPNQLQASSFGPGPFPCDSMEPPEINIDFAPPSQQASFEPPKPSQDSDALSPPERSRTRNRIRTKSDPFSAVTARSQSADALRARTRSVLLSDSPPSLHESTEISHRVNNLETKRTQKHPAVFQCSLCPKRFTRAYNLRSHLRTHTDERPFICSVCGKAFARQHDRKRHESLHSAVSKSKYAYTYGSDEDFSASEHQHAGDTGTCEKQIAILRAGWATQAEESGWRSDNVDHSHAPQKEYQGRQAQSSYSGEDMTPDIVYEEGWAEGYDPHEPKSLHLRPQSIDGSGTFTTDEPRREHLSRAGFSGPPAPVPSDSGYRSGLGTDTESVCSLDSVGSTFGLPADFLQEFIAFFGDTLIEKSGAQRWAEHALTLHSSDVIETQLAALLKAYAVELTSNPPKLPPDSLKKTQRVQHSADGQALTGAARLIRRYRPKIVRYFRDNALSESAITVSLSERLQQLGQQLSLTERLGLFAKPTSNTDDTMETALDAEMDDEDGEGITDLALVQELLVSCRAFEHLALALRRILYHDDGLQMANVRTWVLKGLQNAACDTNSTTSSPPEVGYEPLHLARFDVNWPVFDFMCSQYGTNFPNIGAVVTLTGSALYAQATTCAEYVKTTWPSSGPAFLELLEAGLLKLRKESRTGTVKIEQVLSSSYRCLEFGPTSSGKIEITVQGTDEVIIELAQQLCWIGSAVNTSPFGEQLAYARPLLQERSFQTSCSRFEISFTHQPLQATETACWLPLFCGATIACGFPIPDRGDEVGLEIPLELLAGISGVCRAVEYEGGVVMKGFSHMFVPVRKEQDRVQWHVIASLDPEIRLSYRDALSRCENRALLGELSLGDLSQSRAFVGWCSLATSRLGSELTNFENIDYSGAVNADSAVRCAGGSLGFQQFGMASLDFKLGAKDGKCHFQRSGPYQRIVSAAERTSVVLYDNGEQRAWLVPASGVMLHVAQHRHWLEPFTVNGKKIKPDTNCPPGSSAKELLLKNSSVRLSDADEYTFKDMILNIWSLLEFLIDQNVIRDCNALGAPIKGTLREYLYGFEYKAVVEERSPLRLKQILLGKTHGGWPQLVRDIDALVLLADGFEDIILPAEEGNTRLCHSWQRVPKGQDYLATSTKTLKDLYDVAGCRLNRKYLTSTQLLWHQGDSRLFDDCEETKACQCNRLQQIIPKSAIGAITTPGRLADNGAVIFGCSGWSMLQGLTSKPRLATPKKSGVYSQPNVPLQPIVIRHQSEDSPMSDGENLGESDATTNSTPGSSSSCTTASTQDTPTKMHDFGMEIDESPCSRNRRSLPETFLAPSDNDVELEAWTDPR